MIGATVELFEEPGHQLFAGQAVQRSPKKPAQCKWPMVRFIRKKIGTDVCGAPAGPLLAASRMVQPLAP